MECLGVEFLARVLGLYTRQNNLKVAINPNYCKSMFDVSFVFSRRYMRCCCAQFHHCLFVSFQVSVAMIQEERWHHLSQSQCNCVTAAAATMVPVTGQGCRMDILHQTRFKLLLVTVCCSHLKVSKLIYRGSNA